jgi:hypothetical protein
MKPLWFTHCQGISDNTIGWKDHGHGDLRCGGSFAVSYMAHQATITGDAYAALFCNSKTIEINDARK